MCLNIIISKTRNEIRYNLIVTKSKFSYTLNSRYIYIFEIYDKDEPGPRN